jgi:long-chain acyl-CoA synthetase
MVPDRGAAAPRNRPGPARSGYARHIGTVTGVARLLLAHRDRTDFPALIDDEGETSWRDLDDRVNRLIHVLRAAGVAPGERIAVLSGNRRELYEVFLAVAHAGVLVVPINWHFAAEEVEYVVENSGSKLLVVDPEYARNANGVTVPQLTMGPGGSYEAALSGAPADDPTDQSMGGVMFYTSGTTGRPKGVANSSFATGVPPEVYELMAAGMVNIGFPKAGRTLLCGPAYHSAQWAFTFFPLIGGSSIVLQRRFVPEQTLELIDRHEITNVHLVPTQFVRLLRVEQDRRDAFDGSSLSMVLHGAAPCSPEVKRQMIAWWGPKVTEYYGATEGGVVSIISAAEWLERPGSVGRPMGNMQLRIVTEEGHDAEPGEPGVIHVRNLMGSDFEYLGEPEKTAQAHSVPGFFTLGDIGYVDAEGYLYLSDRKIDMIISGGVNIYPAEIEGAITAHPAVVDAAVFGVPDEEFGEAVKAAVQLAPGVAWNAALAEELTTSLRSRLAGYKVPRSWDVVDVMPRSEAGKLLKRQLRAPYWEAVGRSI